MTQSVVYSNYNTTAGNYYTSTVDIGTGQVTSIWYGVNNIPPQIPIPKPLSPRENIRQFISPDFDAELEIKYKEETLKSVKGKIVDIDINRDDNFIIVDGVYEKYLINVNSIVSIRRIKGNEELVLDLLDKV